MGVHGLWPILSELCERKPLTYLSGKTVAVDLSGWVVEAISCKGLNTSKSPHLRNLFFRISRLLQLGVYPIFVMEGDPPVLKTGTFKDRNWSSPSESGTVSRSNFDRILNECQDLLNTLGVPCIKSSGEGEAFCAFLNLKEIVDGVITEDTDAFLYGADVIYRNFSIDPNDSHVNAYCLKSIKNTKNFDREKLVALSLLLGCDYVKGVPGIGKETAVKFISEINCEDVLQRFKDWKSLSESELFPGLDDKVVKKSSHCTRCEHLGTSAKHKKDGCSTCKSKIACYLSKNSIPCRCPWHMKNELLYKWKTELKIYNIVKEMYDFPDMKVIDEYLNYTDNIPSDDALKWDCPNLTKFQEKALHYLGWTFQYSFEKILPLITSWQQCKLGIKDSDKTHFIYEPVEILKERSIRGDSHYEVKWKIISEDCESNISDEDLITTEFGERFSNCYKDIVCDFYKQLEEEKEAKQKSKKLKIAESSRKIDEFYKKSKKFKKEEKPEQAKCIDTMDTDEQNCELHPESNQPKLDS